ncbi:MAG: NADH-quinone oxidoreductase subunit C [Spirochaetota bacterium]
MIDQIVKFPALEEIYRSIESGFKDSIIESKFEKDELSVKIKKDDLPKIIQFLIAEKGFNALNDIIALDNLSSMKQGQKRFSVLYQLYKFPAYLRIRLIVDVDAGESVESIYKFFKASDWAEREIYDMFGISFNGHPDLKRIYMPNNFTEFPLRKDFPLEGKN